MKIKEKNKDVTKKNKNENNLLLNIFFDLDDTLINTSPFVNKLTLRLVNELLTELKVRNVTKEEKEILKKVFRERIEYLDKKNIIKIVKKIIKILENFRKEIKVDLNKKLGTILYIDYLSIKLELLYFREISSLEINKNKIKVIKELGKLKDVEIYLLTEGDKDWQTKKIASINLNKFLKLENIFILNNKKIKSYQKIKRIVENKNKNKKNIYIMIGDKINRDILNSKKAGFVPIYYINKTKLRYKKDEKNKKIKKEYQIKNFKELFEILKQIKKNKNHNS